MPLDATHRIAVARMITEAIQQWGNGQAYGGLSDVTVDKTNPTILHANLRPPGTSRVFTATIYVANAAEV